MLQYHFISQRLPGSLRPIFRYEEASEARGQKIDKLPDKPISSNNTLKTNDQAANELKQASSEKQNNGSGEKNTQGSHPATQEAPKKKGPEYGVHNSGEGSWSVHQEPYQPKQTPEKNNDAKPAPAEHRPGDTKKIQDANTPKETPPSPVVSKSSRDYGVYSAEEGSSVRQDPYQPKQLQKDPTSVEKKPDSIAPTGIPTITKQVISSNLKTPDTKSSVPSSTPLPKNPSVNKPIDSVGKREEVDKFGATFDASAFDKSINNITSLQEYHDIPTSKSNDYKKIAYYKNHDVFHGGGPNSGMLTISQEKNTKKVDLISYTAPGQTHTISLDPTSNFAKQVLERYKKNIQ